MEDYRLEQTGQEVQRILNGAAMDANLQAEVERATDAEGTLQDNIDAEAQARQDADGLLQQAIDDEAQRAKDAEESNAGEIEGIKALIPSTATPANKLADTNYVNSSIQTATAEYRGDYNVVTDLHLAIDATHAQIETLLPTVIAEADKNDYCYVMIPTNASTPTEIAKIERYKMTSEGWKFEYDVNNSTFTAEEWAAIKSGITSGLVAKLNALPTNADLLLLLAGKQDVLTFDATPVPESNNPVKSGGVYSAIDDEKTARLNSDTAIHAELDGLQAKVPATASSDNKLVDQNQMNSSISTATATFRGDWNVVSDLHLAVDATRAQIAALLPTVISTADNNDYCYVEIPTSAETPTQIERVERYKFNGTAWGYEYVLNNSGFTADQWAAINSMITSGLVAKLSALPTNADLLAMFATKQDVLTFDSTPTENSTNPVTSSGVFAADKALSDAIEAILLLIPSAASALNKLVDTALMNSSISTATATFRGTYNLVSDLGLGIDATEGEIAAALLANISTADNNDYAFVQIPTSAETPAQIARTDRYKFNGTAWAFEYTLNTSGFTAAQWAAINSGVTDTLVAELTNIANLILSEASQYNKLADKVYVITQIIAHIADFKGEYGTLLELQSVLNPKPGDLGIVRTKDNDGKDVYTFYQYKDSLWNEYYTLSYHPQIKPVTTGTTGDYPYNGMGRVELPMNMVNGVNTLTQDMFYKGTIGFREPNTNTVFVIKYDFTLGEDITVPANCILDFDGGSISGNGTGKNTITGTETQIRADKVAIFTGIVIAGTWNVPYITSDWFSDATNENVLKQVFNLCSENTHNNVFIEDGTYYVSVAFDNDAVFTLKNNTRVVVIGTIQMLGNGFPQYKMFYLYHLDNVVIEGTGYLKGDALTHDYSTTESTHEHGHGIRPLGCINIKIRNLHISHFTGDGIDCSTSSQIEIDGVIIEKCRRQGITIGRNTGTIIKNFNIGNIGSFEEEGVVVTGTNPMAAIDIEAGPTYTGALGVHIINGYIENCTKGIEIMKTTGDGTNDYYNENIFISNIAIYNTYYSFKMNRCRNVSINNIISDGSEYFIYGANHDGLSVKNIKVTNCNEFYQITTSNLFPSKVIFENCEIRGLMSDCFFIGDTSSEGYNEGICQIDINNIRLIAAQDNSCHFFTNRFNSPESVIANISNSIVESKYFLYNNLPECLKLTVKDCNIKGYSSKFGGNISIIGSTISDDSTENMIVASGGNINFINSYFKSDKLIINVQAAAVLFADNCIFETTLDHAIVFSAKNVIQNSSIKIGNGSGTTFYHVRGINSTIKNCDFYVDNVLSEFKNYSSNVIILINDPKCGSTQERPTLVNASNKGQVYFDTTLGKPIYWNGTAWVDATGTPV